MKSIRIIISACASLVLTLQSSLAAPPDIKVGVILCLSSACANDGQSALVGLKMAVEDINAKGGVLGRQVKLSVEDSSEGVSGAKAVTAYRKLRLDPEIKYFIGPTWAPGGLSLAPIVSKDTDVIMVSPQTGAKEFSAAGSNLFNTLGSSDSFAITVANNALKNGTRNIGLIGSDQPWESSQTAIFEQAYKNGGGVISAKVVLAVDSTSFKSELTRVLASNPEAIMLTVVNQLPEVAKELKRQGYSGPLYAAYVDGALFKQAEGALTGATFATFEDPSPAFSARYKSIAGADPGMAAAPAYDALTILARAIEETQSENIGAISEKIAQAKFQGMSGDIRFGADRNAIRNIIVRQIAANGEITKLKM